MTRRTSPEAGGVEAAAVAEDAPDLLVLPRRHLLEHVQLARDELEAERRTAQQAQCRGDLARADMAGGALDLAGGELQPELGGLMDGLEEELVGMRLLLRRLLQARAGRPCGGSARSPTRPARGGSARRSPRGSPSPRRVGSILPGHDGDLFSDAAAASAAGGGAPGAPAAAADAGRVRRPAAGARRRARRSALAIAEDRIRSTIFYGPPGSGKTTLARIVAARDGGRVRGAVRGVGDGRTGARGARARARAARVRTGRARSSSSTRSTASTRRSRTRCCRRSRRGW